MDKFNFSPTDGFRDSSYFPDPGSETETRDQLQTLHDQTRDFINTYLLTLSDGQVVRLRINDGTIEYSEDGETWTATDAFKVQNASGQTLPNAKFLKFANSQVAYDEESSTITVNGNGEQGPPGAGIIAGGLKGQCLVKKSDLDYDTVWGNIKASSTDVITVNQTITEFEENTDPNWLQKFYCDITVENADPDKTIAFITFDPVATSEDDAKKYGAVETKDGFVRIWFREEPTSYKVVSVILTLTDDGGEISGTSDYNDLANKPSIEDITLQGNKTFEDLGMSEMSNVEIQNIYNQVFGS